MSDITVPGDTFQVSATTGQISAELGYWSKKPAIVLKAKKPRGSNKDKRYLIKLDHIWLYSEDHYEQVNSKMPKEFKDFMLAKCLDLYELFDLGTPTSRQLAETAWLIQDTIDQLMKMPPQETRRKPVGEATMKIQALDGSDPETFETEVFDDDLAQ